MDLPPTWKQRVAKRITCVVLTLQGAFLLTLWVTPTWTPPRVKFIELVWAWMHRPTFYPLVALTVGGPILSIVAWCCRGRHRRWLIAGWLVLAVVLYNYHYVRTTVMLRTLWWYLNR